MCTIRIQGQVTKTLMVLIDDLQIRRIADKNQVNLYGWLPDQTALLSILNTLHDLHYAIISVSIYPEKEPESTNNDY